MSNILILFGSTGGNTKIVVDKVSNVLISQGHQVTVKRIEKASAKDPFNFDLTILASPTYGHGVLQKDVKVFREKMLEESYINISFAVIGLGDYKYDADYHLESANILEETITDLKGILAHDALRVSKSPLKTLTSIIPKWAQTLSDTLKK